MKLSEYRKLPKAEWEEFFNIVDGAYYRNRNCQRARTSEGFFELQGKEFVESNEEFLEITGFRPADKSETESRIFWVGDRVIMHRCQQWPREQDWWPGFWWGIKVSFLVGLAVVLIGSVL